MSGVGRRVNPRGARDAARKAAAALLLLWVVIAAGCAPNTGGGTPPTDPFEMVPMGPPGTGVQTGRAFSVRLNFVRPGTNTPMDVGKDVTISVRVLIGTGSLSGTTQRKGAGRSYLDFDDLRLNGMGAHMLQFISGGAVAPAPTGIFQVGPQMDLEFATTPHSVLASRPFDVTVRTVDPLTRQPLVPPAPLSIAINAGDAQPLGFLGGNGVAVLQGASSLTFHQLTWSHAETVRLRADAYGCPTVFTQPFDVDELALEFASVPSSIHVSTPFSLHVNLVGARSGHPLAPPAPVAASLLLASGGGSLTGNTQAVSNGSTLSFTNLRYGQVGQMVLSVYSAGTPVVHSPPITVGITLKAEATGSTTLAPGAPLDPILLRVEDGAGAPFPGVVGPVNWHIVASNGQIVQQAQAFFTGHTTAVLPLPLTQPESYELVAEIMQPAYARAVLGLSVTNLQLVNGPGPFVALKSVRTGSPYMDSLAHAAPSGVQQYGLHAGALPPGLALNIFTGAVSGTPTAAGSYIFSVLANLPGGVAQEIRCALAVFSADESEIVPGQDFGDPGPYQVSGPAVHNHSFTSSYDGAAYPTGGFPCRLEVWHPAWTGHPQPPARVPVLLFHRGRGYNMVDYAALGRHLASWGFMFVSIEGITSFRDGGGSGQSPLPQYDTAPEQGMLSASAFQEGALQWAAEVNAQQGHALRNRMDLRRVFVSGHSRGGGASQASHVRSAPYVAGGQPRQNINVRGVVCFMAFDLRYFNSTVNGTAQVYPIPTAVPKLPSLFLAAENDRDLFYPFCDQFIDRATGPCTFATVYGGCHAYLTDTGTFDASTATISRQQQQRVMFNLTVAFLRRWAFLDVSLDGLLYNNELAGSSTVGITAHRNMMEALMVDDHQNGNPSLNSLGGANALTAGAFSIAGSIYPSLGNLSTLGLRHNVLTLIPGTVAVYTTDLPPASRNLQRARRLVFRCGTVDLGHETLKGYDWMTLRVRLVAANGSHATLTLFDRNNQHNTWLPDHQPGSSPYNRFVDVSVPLSQFISINSTLPLDQVSHIELEFETAGASSRQFYFDDLRFE